MKQFGHLYAQYYDLLYKDKDYKAEAEYIDGLIKAHTLDKQLKKSKHLLDLGCGTGKHAELFCNKGYLVEGIDLSRDMINIAQGRTKGKENRLTFSHCKIQEYQTNKKFDIICSLFHVMSYQNSNQDLIRAFDVVKEYLTDNGLFIFDFWYGPAVLTELPGTRIKRMENDAIKVTRIAEPTMHPQQNTVNVNYNIFIRDKNNNHYYEKNEQHDMRYFFDTELELICKQLDLRIENKLKWMEQTQPDFNSWNVVWVLKNIRS
jgi:SAM-dependent methyltransferase